MRELRPTRRAARLSIASLAALLAAGGACTYPPTEVIVGVATDITRPMTLRITARRPDVPGSDGQSLVWISGGPLETVRLRADSTAEFTVVPSDRGPRDQRVEIEFAVTVASATANAPPVWFRRIARFRFVPRLPQHLGIFLSSRCGYSAVGCTSVAPGQCTQSVLCEERGSTCGDDGTCTAPEVTTTGNAPDAAAGFDATVADARDAVSAPETSDAADRVTPIDATGVTDAAANTPTCCGPSCIQCPDLPFAISTCSGGACGFVCRAGYDDCTSAPGCETDLSTGTNCGGCGRACSGSTPICAPMGASFACTSAPCILPRMICSGACIDVRNDPNHCGSCSNACGSVPNGMATCTAGVCDVICDPSFHNCMGDCVSDDDVAHCGNSCDPCSSNHCTPTCDGTSCGCIPDTGYGDCNHDLTDGYESPLGTSMNCRSCGDVCVDPYQCNSHPFPSPPTCDSICAGTMCGTACVDTQTDVNNCGVCGRSCAGANLVAACVAGSCTGTCVSGWGDCDAVIGCETRLNTIQDCGACNRACVGPPNTAASCMAGGTCTFRCAGSFRDCSTTQPGCETNAANDPNNCGSCGFVCSLPHSVEGCALGGCTIASCNPGWGNCDGGALNGCETDVLTSFANCGSCAHRCSSGQTCVNGVCS